jgi:hypothetical protein
VPVSPPGPFYRPVAHEPAPVDPAMDGVPSVEAQPPASAMPFETAVLADVAPDSADAPPFWEPEPTEMMDAVDLEQDPPARVPQPVPTSVFPPQTRSTEALDTGEPAGLSETGQVSAIDALFGENQFREYTEGLDPSQNPFVRQAEDGSGRSPVDPTGPGVPPGPPPAVSRTQRILLWVLGGTLALLAIVALFFLGARLPDLLGPAPAVVVPSGTPSPSASPGFVLGPVEPGEYAWDELLGGECLDPFQDPWQTTYVVVDCAAPHPAQMVRRGVLPEATADTGLYPGEDIVQTQVIALCRGGGIFDPATVSALPDVVVSASYPTEEDWNDGGRDYFCFVTRSSGELITGDLALPQPTPPPRPPLTKAP